LEQNNSENISSYDDEFISLNIKEWIIFFWSNKYVFIKVSSVALILGVIIALLLPQKYTAIVTILPPQSSNRPSMLSQLSQVVGNFSIGGDQINELYPDIATSRSVLMEVLNSKYNKETFLNVLIKEHNIDQKNDEIVVKENVFKLLRDLIDTNVNRKTALVTIKVTDYDPEIAAALVNEVLNQMDIYLRYNLKTAATDQSQTIENRLNVIADSLKITEDNLLQFRESNRTTNLSPKLQIFEMRLLRKVEVNNAVYVELSRQLEMVKIQEIQLKPVLNILDKATPPIEKSWPPRKKIVFMFLLITFFFSVGYIKFKDQFLNKQSGS